MAKKEHPDNRAVVIGLGRFGSSLALELVSGRTEVLGLDRSEKLVNAWADDLTHVAVVDSTDEEALRQLNVQDYPRAVVAIGADLEASILTTSILSDFGIKKIWAKALSRQHAKILERVGAHHVVLPEHDMGERVAHLLSGRMLDYVEIEENFALGKTRAPLEIIGRRLGETGVRSAHGITVVCIKRHGESFTYATADTVPQKGDIVIVAGKTDDVERFAELK